MRKIEKVQTFDGKEHATEAAARLHLENLLGAIIDQYAQKLALMTKITEVRECLQNLLPSVSHDVARIVDDMTTED